MSSEPEYEPILDPEYFDLFQEEFQYPLFDFDTNSNGLNNNTTNTNEIYNMSQLQSDFEQMGELSQLKKEKEQEQKQIPNTNPNPKTGNKDGNEENKQKQQDKEKSLYLIRNKDSNPYLFSKQSSFSNNQTLKRIPSLERFLTFERVPSLERLPSFGRMNSFTRQPSFPRQRSFQRKPSLDRLPSFGNPNKGLNNWMFSQTNTTINNSNLRGSNFANSTNHNDRNLFTHDLSLESVYKVRQNNNISNNSNNNINENLNQSFIIKKKNHKNPIYIPKLQKKSSSQSILFSPNTSKLSFLHKQQLSQQKQNHQKMEEEKQNEKDNENGNKQSQDSNNFLKFLNHPNIEMIVGSQFDQGKNNLSENQNEQNNFLFLGKKQNGKENENENLNSLTNEVINNSGTNTTIKNSGSGSGSGSGRGKGKLQKTKTQFILKNSKEIQSEPMIIASKEPPNKEKQMNLTHDNFNSKIKKLSNSQNQKNEKLIKNKPQIKKGKKRQYKKKKTRVRIKIGTRHRDGEKNPNEENSKMNDFDEDSRKRFLKLHSLNKNNSVVIESGKEVFKLLTGQLWVISGGAPQKVLAPYTDKFVQKIGNLFKASDNEEESFQGQLKYLLSNSRRTFTEFILEILIGILSLKYSENVPEISLKFWKILEDASQVNSRNENNGGNEDNSTNNNNNDNNNTNNSGIGIDEIKIENENEKMTEKEKLNIRLEGIYQEIYTQKVLMFWFDKRFVERLGAFFNGKDKKNFYEQHLFYLGKSKFILSCLLSAQELIKKEDGIPEKYYKLVNLEFKSNPLNVYLNNRGKKLNLVKDLIIKYGLNNGSFWNIISKDYLGKMKFREENIFDYFPFKNLITNPLLAKLCKKVSKEKPQKKRNVSSSNVEKSQVQINVDWLFKKRAI
ncbi:cysteine and glycine-rich protein 2 binding protein [Anaeramoeba flamelloides]|uniref:Cysteine and glycine-rich protein 2 binding protein n=1 Tax=Anaeramoeba flamelloides TaxID=1746091 RepID=A0AAV7ZRN5_9EUKA|nr:cysteine and glycine-rich protein 2 binding protein [Anaeramoeba flamelloides]